MRGVTHKTNTFLDDIKTTGDGEDLRQVLRHCSKHKLNMISRVAKEVKNDKYGTSDEQTRDLRGPRSEVLTEDMLNTLFISKDMNEKWRYTFILQLFVNMRPSEVESLELVPGYWRERSGETYDAFYLWNEKVDRDEYKPAPRFVKQVYDKWVGLFDGEPGYSAPYLNQVFQEVRGRLGWPWDETNHKDRADGTTSYLYSNKSLRHTSKALFREAVGGDQYKIAHHMHHNVESHVGSQGAYGRYDPGEWVRDLKRAFLPYYEMVRGECEDTGELFPELSE